MDQVEGQESKNKHVGTSMLGPGQRPETHLRKWGPGRERRESSGQKEDSQRGGHGRRKRLGSQMQAFLTAPRIII